MDVLRRILMGLILVGTLVACDGLTVPEENEVTACGEAFETGACPTPGPDQYFSDCPSVGNRSGIS